MEFARHDEDPRRTIALQVTDWCHHHDHARRLEIVRELRAHTLMIGGRCRLQNIAEGNQAIDRAWQTKPLHIVRQQAFDKFLKVGRSGNIWRRMLCSRKVIQWDGCVDDPRISFDFMLKYTVENINEITSDWFTLRIQQQLLHLTDI